MAKLVDVPDLGSGAGRHGGSSPSARTQWFCHIDTYVPQITSHLSLSNSQLLDIHIEHTANQEALIKVKIIPADYQSSVQKKIKEYARKVQLPGFRTGHVPLAHIQRLYGDTIRTETIQKLLEEHVNKYIKEQQLRTLGSPLIEEDALQAPVSVDGHYSFKYRIGLHTEPSLEGFTKTKFVRYHIEPEAKDIDEVVENIQYRFGPITHPTQVPNPPFVLCGAIVNPQGKTEEVTLSSEGLRPEVLNTFKNKELQSAHTLILSSLYEHVPAQWQRLEKQGIDLNQPHTFTLSRIDQPQKAALDVKLFEKIYGQAVSTKEEFLARTKNHLGTQYEKQADMHLYRMIKAKLCTDFAPTLPEEYLKVRFSHTIQASLNDATFQTAFEQYKNELRWRIWQDTLSKKEEIKVSPEELKQEVERLILRQANIWTEATEEQRKQLQPLVAKFFSEKKNIESLYVQLQEEKTLKFLSQQVDITSQKISITDFHKQINT